MAHNDKLLGFEYILKVEPSKAVDCGEKKRVKNKLKIF